MSQETKTIEEVAKQINESIETKATKEEVTALKAELETSKEQAEELNKRFQALTEKTNGMQEIDIVKEVENFLEENHQALKQSFKQKTGVLDISKAVGIVTTANGTLPTALPANYVAQTEGVKRVGLRRASLLDNVNTFSTNKTTFPYIETVAGEGDFEVVAEGGLKPQLDIDWVTRYATPIKFAGWIKVTEEAIDDIPYLRDTIVNYLKDKHDLFKETQVFSYLNTNAKTFAVGAMANSVVAPNIVDVVNAILTMVATTPNFVDEQDYSIDTVLLNPIDYFKYFATVKDATGRNLYSDAMLTSGSMDYNGVRFISTQRITAGNIMAFDSRVVNVTTYIPYGVSIGWVNDDFIRNQFVILGESRGHIFVKNLDLRAVVKGSIATIMTALAVVEA